MKPSVLLRETLGDMNSVLPLSEPGTEKAEWGWAGGRGGWGGGVCCIRLLVSLVKGKKCLREEQLRNVLRCYEQQQQTSHSFFDLQEVMIKSLY